MKDLGGQQSRFKWMMEGHSSPDTSSPDNPFHKNGVCFFFVLFCYDMEGMSVEAESVNEIRCDVAYQGDL